MLGVKMKKILCLILAVSVLSSGCSAFVSKTQAVNVSCSESDAVVQINGGQTYPGQVRVDAKRDKPLSIACYKQGYYPAQKSVHSSLSGTGIADLLGSFIFIIPVIGFFSPGAWDLDESEVTVNMVKH
jgi:uncharacterized protein YceK